MITDRWKGMNQTQIDSIRETQASQVQERKMREDEAARLQKEWDTNRPGLIFANQLWNFTNPHAVGVLNFKWRDVLIKNSHLKSKSK